ncbi:MAG: hypothetical protein J2P44_13090, partial [Candidatus Dormibacteraeota bacterium]|nr:hypothetical protein [Candidatus Dormibacteraeota bacterium]
MLPPLVAVVVPPGRCGLEPATAIQGWRPGETARDGRSRGTQDCVGAGAEGVLVGVTAGAGRVVGLPPVPGSPLEPLVPGGVPPWPGG